jgi:molybdate transport system substrate-binding protein
VARARSVAAQQIRRRYVIVGGLLLALGALIVVAMLLPKAGKQRVTVFAAASLADVMAEVEAQFEAAYPDVDLVVSTAATSVLARQIEQGAPADVFLSASPTWTDYLAARDLLRYPARDLVSNRLVAVGAPDAPLLAGPEDLLRYDRIALADEGVPAGDYAREALRRAGLWDEVAPRVIPTRDVRAALAAVRTGAAPVALVYRSDVQAAPDVRVVLDWPAALQPRVRYTMAIPRTTEHPTRALEFFEFIRDSERLDLWRRHGFDPLAEPVLP